MNKYGKKTKDGRFQLASTLYMNQDGEIVTSAASPVRLIGTLGEHLTMDQARTLGLVSQRLRPKSKKAAANKSKKAAGDKKK